MSDGDPDSGMHDVDNHTDSGRGDSPASPSVGLGWAGVASLLDTDLKILMREGIVVLAGEYFPEAGFALDPTTAAARWVDVGHVALRHCLFLGELTLRDLKVNLTRKVKPGDRVRHPVIPQPSTGPIIGLFMKPVDARRAKQQIMQGSLGWGLSVQQGPLGHQLVVERSELGGRVASIIASHGGSIISIGGHPLVGQASVTGPMAPGDVLRAVGAENPRDGTGSTGAS